MEWKQLLATVRFRQILDSVGSNRNDTETRSEFERDYGRVIFSTPIRRLQEKAQVFPIDPMDVVRTRLTHSQEVASLARGMGNSIGRWLNNEKEISKDTIDSIEWICATCAMIHDLGNPPFGHAGEDAIRDWFRIKVENEELNDKDESLLNFRDVKLGVDEDQLRQDFLRFEGNAQTLRILTRLQVLTDLRGLNLTLGTLSASRKYTVPSHKIGAACYAKKPGHFASEQDLVDLIAAETGTGDARNPITFLVEACDDIVYAIVDIEDGIKKDVIRWEDVDKHLTDNLPSDFYNELKRRMNNQIGTARISQSDLDMNEVYSQVFRTQAIGLAKEAAEDQFKLSYDKIMKGDYTYDLLSPTSAGQLLAECKKFARGRIYSARNTLIKEIAGRKVIHDLMDLFWWALSEKRKFNTCSPYAQKVYEVISRNYRLIFENTLKQGSLPSNYCRLQLVTDYVCGMTDTYAYELHKKLTNG